MGQNEVNLFDVDPESGEIIYSPAEGEEIDQDDILESEEPVEDAGDAAAPSDEVGDLLYDPENVSENVEETEAEASNVDLLDSGIVAVPVVSQEQYAVAYLAASPVGGSIGSSTLDLFDRIVSGLPADCRYVAYRTSSDSSYDAVLYYGDDYEISGNVITFEKAVQIEVQRVSSSGYSTETYVTSSEVTDEAVSFDQSSTIVYYTDAAVGYPLLGGYEMRKDYGFFIVPALIGALAVVIMSKLLFRR